MKTTLILTVAVLHENYKQGLIKSLIATSILTLRHKWKETVVKPGDI